MKGKYLDGSFPAVKTGLRCPGGAGDDFPEEVLHSPVRIGNIELIKRLGLGIR